MGAAVRLQRVLVGSYSHDMWKKRVHLYLMLLLPKEAQEGLRTSSRTFAEICLKSEKLRWEVLSRRPGPDSTPEGMAGAQQRAPGPASLVKTARGGAGRAGELFRAATWLMIVKIIWELKKHPRITQNVWVLRKLCF